MAMIEPRVKELAQGKNFAAFSTLLPSGQPMTHVMWVDANDDYVLINTEVDRQKYKNVEHDPRVTVTVIDAANPYNYVEVRGKVVDKVTGPEARAHIDTLSQKYNGQPYPAENIRTERVILRIAPDRQRSNG
jgi:PPOX class probable F420-dependent enzyme